MHRKELFTEKKVFGGTSLFKEKHTYGVLWLLIWKRIVFYNMAASHLQFYVLIFNKVEVNILLQTTISCLKDYSRREFIFVEEFFFLANEPQHDSVRFFPFEGTWILLKLKANTILMRFLFQPISHPPPYL